MKKIKILLLGFAILFGTSFMFSSCALVGVGLFTDIKATPMMLATRMDASTFSKEGKAESSNILGLINTGDCSVTEAMKNGGITKIHHVDIQTVNYLGLFGKTICHVYGE